jgi:FKBP-type peptidyl-prolyl cis-trans isomerase 2
MIFRVPVAILSFLCVLGLPCAAFCTETMSPAQPASFAEGTAKSAKAPATKGGKGKADKASGLSRVQGGDLVAVNFTASTENGELIRTTLEKISQDAARVKSAYFQAPPAFVPEDVVAGQLGGSVPGLGEVVVGMAQGEKKTVVLQPDKAYGAIDPAKRKDLPCVMNIPKTIRMSPQDYVGKFRAFPVVGKEVSITPYFKAAVVEVSEQFAVLDCHAEDGKRFEESFGTVETKVGEQDISIVLTPRLGSNFSLQGGLQGKITATDGTTYTVDSNNPLAGMPVTVAIEIASVTKAARLDSLRIQWVEDHDKGIALAREQGKPAVLVLYADWCGFSKKLLGETLQDPRVRALKDRFVWIKVNSDREAKFKQQYAQDGFPLIVILNREGQQMDRIDGFRDAAAFRDELVKTSKSL